MKNGFLFIMLLWVSIAFSQKLPVLGTQELQAQSFLGYDTLGAYYSVTDNVFTKQMGGQQWQYKNPQLGKLTAIDLQNPLRIVLFYQDFNTVILVDNQLNETSKINLSDSTNPIVPSAIGLAAGNRLWIYNNLTQRIGLYDITKRELKTLTIPFRNNLKHYSADFNAFHWVDDLGNAYRCDIYGKIQNLGAVPDGENIQWISESCLIYRKNNQLYQYNLIEKKSTLLEIDEKTFQNFSCKDQILSIFTDHRITNYKIAVL